MNVGPGEGAGRGGIEGVIVLGVDGGSAVHGAAEAVENATEKGVADRYAGGFATRHDAISHLEAVGFFEGH